MKIFEIKDYKKPQVLSLPYGLEFHRSYHYYPSDETDSNGERVFLFQSYNFDSERRRSCAIISPGEIHMRILPYDHVKDNRIILVRILTGIEIAMAPYSRSTSTIRRKDDGELVTFPLKKHPEFTNFDLLTDEEFIAMHGRIRNMDDHGLVGHLWVDDEMNFRIQGEEEDTNPRDPADDDDEAGNKLAMAIKVFVANQGETRVNIIKMIASANGMSEAGSTSYYTHAKHAIKDPRGKGAAYQHAVKVAKTL